MTQNTLSDEIERVVNQFKERSKLVRLPSKDSPYMGYYPEDVVMEEIRQAAKSIAEKTVEAVRVEKEDFIFETNEEQRIGWNIASGYQSKLASDWLGKEEV